LFAILFLEDKFNGLISKKCITNVGKFYTALSIL